MTLQLPLFSCKIGLLEFLCINWIRNTTMKIISFHSPGNLIVFTNLMPAKNILFSFLSSNLFFPALYNYLATSANKDYLKFSQLAWNLLRGVWRIGIKYCCGSITKDAGNIMRAIYHSWNPIHTKKYLSKYIYLKQKGLAAIFNFLLITAFQRPYAE